MSQINGVVKWFSNAKGYGFLGAQSGPDVFVHYTAIKKDGYRSLKEGEQVSYTVVSGPTGRLQAEDVRGLEGETR